MATASTKRKSGSKVVTKTTDLETSPVEAQAQSVASEADKTEPSKSSVKSGKGSTAKSAMQKSATSKTEAPSVSTESVEQSERSSTKQAAATKQSAAQLEEASQAVPVPQIAVSQEKKLAGTMAPIELIVSHDAIATRAFEIWEREGHPHGCEVEHWLRAEQELVSGKRC